jgi:chromosome segregation ATPase
MSDQPDDSFDKVRQYRELVLQYEKIDEEIDALIMAVDGVPDKLSPADRDRYREMANRRDELQNEMRWLEQQLMAEDDNGVDAP